MINNIQTASKKNFRINAIKFFLTFSQIPNDKIIDFKTIQQRILEKLHVKNGIIAKEVHKDGGIHFHIYLELTEKKDIKRSNYFDFIFNHHGKYESCKSRANTIKYITKDMDYFLIGDLKSFANTTLVEDFIRKKVLEGFGVEDFFYFKNNRPIEKFIFDSGHKIDRFCKSFQQHNRNVRVDKLRFIKYFDLTKINDYDDTVLPNKKGLVEILEYLNENAGKRKYKTPMLHL